MKCSETPPTEDAKANGAFGDRLAAYYHLTESETAAVSWTEKSTFAITRLRSDVGLPLASNPIPEEAALHVSVAIKPVPPRNYEPKSRSWPVSVGRRIVHFHGHDAGSFTPWRSPRG